MSSVIKVILLLAAVAFAAHAQTNESGEHCLCGNVRNYFSSKAGVKDMQIYPATIFCNRVEIVVTGRDGSRYCLNPNKLEKVMPIILRNTSHTASS
ncbi:uncharacterized protein ACBR49_007616 [Aulostomus maculatus]